MRANEFVMKEFAPDNGSGGEEDSLQKYARMWYQGDEGIQQQVEQILDRMGWEIGEIESEEGGAFVVQSGDENGNSYIGFAPEDLTEDWQKTNKQDKTDGMSKKAVSAYRKENPGSKLKTAVTKKPSELKAGSKDAKRRKSFCARMSGMKKHNAGDKTKRDPDSPINKALRRWNCESIEEMQELIQLGEHYIAEKKKGKDGKACWDGYRYNGTKNGKDSCVKVKK